MKPTPNIERFNRSAGLILHRLYVTYPERLYLKTDEVDPSPDGAGPAFHEATIEALIRDGLVDGRCINAYDVALYDVGLTTRGIKILRATPAVLAERVPLGERLGRALSKGGTSVLGMIVGQIVELAADRAFGS
jgi:hypothetical protein